MFVFQIKEMLEQKAVSRPFNQLLKMGVTRARAKLLMNGKVQSIRLAELYKFCTYLNCTPKELLKIQLPAGSKSLDNSPLNDWVIKQDMNLVKELIDLSPEKMERVKEFVREMNGE